MMQSIKQNVVLYLTLLLIVFISCKNDDDSNSDCSLDTICTTVFVSIEVIITDANQNPIALNSFEVINLADGSDFTLQLSDAEFQLAQQNGRYPIANDGNVNSNQELELLFKGFINNQEVVSANYIVASDCCHVNLVSGDLQIVLQ